MDAMLALGAPADAKAETARSWDAVRGAVAEQYEQGGLEAYAAFVRGREGTTARVVYERSSAYLFLRFPSSAHVLATSLPVPDGRGHFPTLAPRDAGVDPGASPCVSRIRVDAAVGARLDPFGADASWMPPARRRHDRERPREVHHQPVARVFAQRVHELQELVQRQMIVGVVVGFPEQLENRLARWGPVDVPARLCAFSRSYTIIPPDATRSCPGCRSRRGQPL